MSRFNLIPPRVPIADRLGIVSREWWRWFNNVQTAVDGGASGTIADAVALEFALKQTSGPDYTRQIEDLKAELFALALRSPEVPPQISKKIADIEAWVASLPQTPRQPGISLQQAMAIASWGM